MSSQPNRRTYGDGSSRKRGFARAFSSSAASTTSSSSKPASAPKTPSASFDMSVYDLPDDDDEEEIAVVAKPSQERKPIGKTPLPHRQAAAPIPVRQTEKPVAASLSTATPKSNTPQAAVKASATDAPSRNTAKRPAPQEEGSHTMKADDSRTVSSESSASSSESSVATSSTSRHKRTRSNVQQIATKPSTTYSSLPTNDQSPARTPSAKLSKEDAGSSSKTSKSNAKFPTQSTPPPSKPSKTRVLSRTQSTPLPAKSAQTGTETQPTPRIASPIARLSICEHSSSPQPLLARKGRLIDILAQQAESSSDTTMGHDSDESASSMDESDEESLSILKRHTTMDGASESDEYDIAMKDGEEEESSGALKPRHMSQKRSTYQVSGGARSQSVKVTYGAQRSLLRSTCSSHGDEQHNDPKSTSSLPASVDDIWGASLLGSEAAIKTSSSAFDLPGDDDDDNVNNSIRSIHELRRTGASNRFTDDMEDLLDRIATPSTTRDATARRQALVDLATRSQNRLFARQLRDHNSREDRIFCELGQETDIISGCALLIALFHLFNVSSMAHILRVLEDGKIERLFALLLENSTPWNQLARDPAIGLSRSTRSSLLALPSSLPSLPHWQPLALISTSSELTPRLLALQFMSQYGKEEKMPTYLSRSPALGNALFSLLQLGLDCSSPTDFHLAALSLTILASHSINIMQSPHADRWSQAHLPIVLDFCSKCVQHDPAEATPSLMDYSKQRTASRKLAQNQVQRKANDFEKITADPYSLDSDDDSPARTGPSTPLKKLLASSSSPSPSSSSRAPVNNPKKQAIAKSIGITSNDVMNSCTLNVLRLTMNMTNQNPHISSIRGGNKAFAALAKKIPDLFDQAYRNLFSSSSDSQDPKSDTAMDLELLESKGGTTDHELRSQKIAASTSKATAEQPVPVQTQQAFERLLLCLGIMINFCEHCPAVRDSALDWLSNHHEYVYSNEKVAGTNSEPDETLPRLASVYLNFHATTTEANSVEQTQLNVAFGYLSILLGYLALLPAVRELWESRVPSKPSSLSIPSSSSTLDHKSLSAGSGIVDSIMGSIREFIDIHQRMEKDKAPADHIQRLEALLSKLENR